MYEKTIRESLLSNRPDTPPPKSNDLICPDSIGKSIWFVLYTRHSDTPRLIRQNIINGTITFIIL